jgi:hypothetical protein
MGTEIVGTANPRNLHRKDGASNDDGGGREQSPEEGEDVADSFGTLRLGEGSGESRFFGIAAGAQFLLGVRIILTFFYYY